LLKNGDLSVLLVDQGHDVDQRVCPVTEYKVCTNCTPCNIMCGVGGAGTLSSGLLNLRPDIGGDLIHLLNSEKDAWELIEYVDNIFLNQGVRNVSIKQRRKRYENSKERQQVSE